MSEQLLISINEQLGKLLGEMGGVKARLDEGSRRHADFAEKLQVLDNRTDKMERDVDTIKPVVETVAVHTTTLQRHGQILGRIAAVMGLASAALTGAFWLISYGISHFGEMAWSAIRGKFGH